MDEVQAAARLARAPGEEGAAAQGAPGRAADARGGPPGRGARRARRRGAAPRRRGGRRAAPRRDGPDPRGRPGRGARAGARRRHGGRAAGGRGPPRAPAGGARARGMRGAAPSSCAWWSATSAPRSTGSARRPEPLSLRLKTLAEERRAKGTLARGDPARVRGAAGAGRGRGGGARRAPAAPPRRPRGGRGRGARSRWASRGAEPSWGRCWARWASAASSSAPAPGPPPGGAGRRPRPSAPGIEAARGAASARVGAAAARVAALEVELRELATDAGAAIGRARRGDGGGRGLPVTLAARRSSRAALEELEAAASRATRRASRPCSRRPGRRASAGSWARWPTFSRCPGSSSARSRRRWASGSSGW